MNVYLEGGRDVSDEMVLRYGCNPHQKPARILSRSGELPVRVLSGSPRYMNFMDALIAWQPARELNGAPGGTCDLGADAGTVSGRVRRTGEGCSCRPFSS